MVRLADAGRGGSEVSVMLQGMQQIGHLAGLHALRGLAAIMVLLFHLHHVGHIPLPQSWELIASRGGLGVELFFVLSAFSLMYSNQKYLNEADSRWIHSYLIKRFFRIAPLFYVMLVAHCFLIQYKFNGELNFLSIVMSSLFIFNFSPKGAEGIVWASWSIGVEMVFYTVLPVIMVAIRSLRAAVVLWFVAVTASYVHRRILEADPGIPPGYAHYAFMSQLGVFCGGILGYWTFDRMKSAALEVYRKYWWFIVVFGPLAAIILLTDAGKLLAVSGRPDTQLWGLVFGFITVLSAVSAKRWMAHPILQHLGELSYSIYLTHAVVIYAANTVLRRLYEFCYPTLGGYGFAVCAIAVLLPTLLVSEITYRYFEVPGIALGKKYITTCAVGRGTILEQQS